MASQIASVEVVDVTARLHADVGGVVEAELAAKSFFDLGSFTPFNDSVVQLGQVSL